MNKPSDMAVDRELSAVDQLRAWLGEDDADLALRLDTIEGETQAFEILDALGEHALEKKGLAEEARKRIARLEKREHQARQTVMQIMEKIGIRKAVRPLFTLSVTDGPKAVHITDEAAIPMNFLRISPDKHAIAKALKDGEEVPGAQLNNGPPVLRIIR